MSQSIVCVYCAKPLLDVAHAKKHVVEQCEHAPWRGRLAKLEAEATAARAALAKFQAEANALIEAAENTLAAERERAAKWKARAKKLLTCAREAQFELVAKTLRYTALVAVLTPLETENLNRRIKERTARHRAALTTTPPPEERPAGYDRGEVADATEAHLQPPGDAKVRLAIEPGKEPSRP